MAWFDDLKRTLADQYDPALPANIVGWLQGSASPSVWRSMIQQRNRHQMIILGNREPTREEWGHAGVAGRDMPCAVTIDIMTGFIVLYGGYMLQRPWGSIYPVSNDALTIGFPGALRSWERNRPGRR